MFYFQFEFKVFKTFNQMQWALVWRACKWQDFVKPLETFEQVVCWPNQQAVHRFLVCIFKSIWALMYNGRAHSICVLWTSMDVPLFSSGHFQWFHCSLVTLLHQYSVKLKWNRCTNRASFRLSMWKGACTQPTMSHFICIRFVIYHPFLSVSFALRDLYVTSRSVKTY